MTGKRKQVLLDAIMDCYRKMFLASTPSADFDELMEKAPVNERGQKDIPYMDYELESEEYDKIMDQFLSDKKLKMTALERKAFSQAVNLGCAPKTKSRF